MKLYRVNPQIIINLDAIQYVDIRATGIIILHLADGSQHIISKEDWGKIKSQYKVTL